MPLSQIIRIRLDKIAATHRRYILLCFLVTLGGTIQLLGQDSLSLSKKWSNAVGTWPIDFSTSVELRNGFRTNKRTDLHSGLILGEPRWQLDAGGYLGNWG
ncbi:MAG: hypothetical protein AAF960_14080 [Bacteroidota bacterium]